MRKRIIATLCTCLVFSCLLFCACGKSGDSLELNYYNYDLYVNYSFRIEYSGCPYVQFSSSNDSVATVDQMGVVIGRAIGETVITAKYKNQTKKCTVVVHETEKETPILTLNIDENIRVEKGSVPFSINPKLSLGENQIQAEYEFSSQKENVASVSANGVITPLDYGITAISVSVNYEGEKLTKIIILEVIADVDIRFSEYEYTLYTACVDYRQKTSFEPDFLGVYVDGVKDEQANITYEFDQNLLKFEGGKVEVVCKSSANTEFVAVYYDQNNIKYTCPISVQILFPVLDKTEELHYYVGNWKDSLRGNKIIGREQITFSEKVFDEQITGIYDITTGEEIDLNFNPQTGELVNTELVKGSKTWKIYNENYAVEVSVSVVDMVITTADEFVKTLSIATGEHIVLGNDIENVGHYQNTENVFSGVLDGNYHTVSGLDFSSSAAYGGLFYRIDNAVIKNIAFKDAVLSVYRHTVDGQTTAYPHGLIGYQGYRSTISNVYAQVYSNANEYEGGLFHWIGAGLIFKDMVVVYENKWAGSEVGVLSRTTDAVLTIDNVYVVKKSNISLIKTFASTLTEENISQLNENLQNINVDYNDEQQLMLYRNNLTLTNFLLAVLESDGVGDNYENDDFIE